MYGTHHIGASTNQAQEAIAAETVRIVDDVPQDRKSTELLSMSNEAMRQCVWAMHHWPMRESLVIAALPHCPIASLQESLNVREAYL